MKLTTYHLNGVKGRLDVLLRWFEEATPDIGLSGWRDCRRQVSISSRAWEHTSDHAPVWIELDHG